MIDISSIEFNSLKPPAQSAAIEDLEKITRDTPAQCTKAQWDVLVQCLSAQHPSVKREAARAMANVVHRFPEAIGTCLPALFDNATYSGTVVRWSAATALVAAVNELKKINPQEHLFMKEKINALQANEQKSSIQKIYAKSFKL